MTKTTTTERPATPGELAADEADRLMEEVSAGNVNDAEERELLPFGERVLLDPNDILVNPLNPRARVDLDEALAASIAERGLQQALIVIRLEDGTFMLKDGHHRRLACIEAGLKLVKCDVHPALSGDEQLVDMLVTAIHRKDLSPVEEALAFKQLSDKGLTNSAIAKALSVKPPHVTKRLALLNLPEDVLDVVGKPADEGGLPLDIAYDISRLDDPDEQRKLARTPAPWDVQQALNRQERREMAAKARAALAKEGVREIAPSLIANGVAALIASPGNEFSLQGFTEGAHAIAFTTKQANDHANASCHCAVVIETREAGSQTLYACDEPSSHEKATTWKFRHPWEEVSAAGIKRDAKALEERKAQQQELLAAQRATTGKAAKARADAAAAAEKERAEQEARLLARREEFEAHAAAAESRRTAVVKLIKTPGKPAQQGLLQLGVLGAYGIAYDLEQLVNDEWFDELVLTLLGEPLVGGRDEYGPHVADRVVELVQSDEPKTSARAALAIAAAMAETIVFPAGLRSWDDLDEPFSSHEPWKPDRTLGRDGLLTAKRYLLWLQSNGYSSTKIENDVTAAQ